MPKGTTAGPGIRSCNLCMWKSELVSSGPQQLLTFLASFSDMTVRDGLVLPTKEGHSLVALDNMTSSLVLYPCFTVCMKSFALCFAQGIIHCKIDRAYYNKREAKRSCRSVRVCPELKPTSTHLRQFGVHAHGTCTF